MMGTDIQNIAGYGYRYFQKNPNIETDTFVISENVSKYGFEYLFHVS